MKASRVLFAILFLSLLVASCSKHYDVSQVQGINAEGEVLLPVAHKSFSVRKLMERFQMDNAIVWTDEGDMTFCFALENKGVVKGDDMLRFDDVDYSGHYVFENTSLFSSAHAEDTVVSLMHSIVLESDRVRVMRAVMKSGRLDFVVGSNFGHLQHVVLRSDNIMDEAGNSFELDLPVDDTLFGFDLAGWRYVTDTVNKLNLGCDLYFAVQGTQDPERIVDLGIRGYDLAFSEMVGFVDKYDNRSCIDSIFTLFPDNMGGMLELEGVRIFVNERNTFSMGARLVVDTAMVFSDGLSPYSILEPLPLSIDLPPQLEFQEVFAREVSGQLNAMGGRAYSTSSFIMNPDESSEMVTVVDTSQIDTRIGVEIPFSFIVDNIAYIDTVNLNLQHLDMPNMIEELTLELEFVSTLPFNINASFFMYDSKNDKITDTLLMDADLIRASLDGQPVKTNLTLVVDEDRMENVMQSNRIIMSYRLDSEAHNIDMNVNQKLDLTLKACAKYNAEVGFKE